MDYKQITTNKVQWLQFFSMSIHSSLGMACVQLVLFFLVFSHHLPAKEIIILTIVVLVIDTYLLQLMS